MSYTNRFSLLDSVGEFFDLDHRPSKKARTEAKQQRIFTTSSIDQQKYLIMSHQEEGKMLTKLTPFGVQKGLDGITTGIEEVQKLRSGDLLILAKSRTATEQLKKATTLGGLARIKVTEHPFLNNSKGIVFSYDLLDLTETEITQGLQNQNVIETRRIKKWTDGKLVDTPALVLTFANSKVPEVIKAGYILLKVKLYIPNPLRCTICQRFGHPKKRCNAIPTCPKCAKNIPLGHEHILCDAAKCINCEEEHFAYSRECPVYKKEAEIIKIKTVDRISHKAAKEKYYRQHANTTGAKSGTSSKLFADILKNTSSSASKKSPKETPNTTTESMDVQVSSNTEENSASSKSCQLTHKQTCNEITVTRSAETTTQPSNINHISPFASLTTTNTKPQETSTSNKKNIINKRSNTLHKLKRTTSKEQILDQYRLRETDEDHHSYHHDDAHHHQSDFASHHPRAKLSEAEEAILNSNERQG